MDVILKKLRKELDIPDNIPVKYQKLAKSAIFKNNTAFVGVDRDGNVVELKAKQGPFVIGEQIFLKS
jgi:hypothetical protein